MPPLKDRFLDQKDKAKAKAQQAVEKVKSKLPELPRRPGLPGDPKAEMDAALRRARQSRLGATRGFRILDKYLTDLAARGGTLDDFRQEIGARAKDVASRNRRLVNAATDMASLLKDHSTLFRFREQVILPARQGRITGDQAWMKTRDLTGRDVRQMGREAGPNCTFGVGINLEMAAVLGVQVGYGIAGLLWKNRGWCEGFAIGIGAYAEGEVTGRAFFQVGPPAAGESGVVSVGLGAAYYASVTVSASFVPVDNAPPSEWPFDGITVNVGGGAGVEINLALEVTYYHPFAG